MQQAEIEQAIARSSQHAGGAEVQLKVANIHYEEMEKPDRDYTHAKRAKRNTGR